MRYKLFTFLILAVMLFGGCSADSVEIETLADMKDMAPVVGLPDDIDARDYLLEACPNADIVAQNDVMYGVRSVSEGKLDAFVVGKIYIEKAIKETVPLSMTQKEQILSLREWAKERAVLATSNEDREHGENTSDPDAGASFSKEQGGRILDFDL